MIVDLLAGARQGAPAMLRIMWAIVQTLASAFRTRHQLLLENLALRQQLAAFKARGAKPRIRATDRAFWVLLRRLWARWADALVFVKPDTVVRWHRAGVRLYEYVAYHHDDRTHLGLGKQTPMHRAVQRRRSANAKVIGLPRVGGLHHRYEWRNAA